MKVLLFPSALYCFECGLYLSAERDPIKSAKNGYILFTHVGNNHCEHAYKTVKLPVELIDAEELTS